MEGESPTLNIGCLLPYNKKCQQYPVGIFIVFDRVYGALSLKLYKSMETYCDISIQSWPENLIFILLSQGFSLHQTPIFGFLSYNVAQGNVQEH